MEVMGQPANKLATDAAYQLWEDLRWYWPAFGNNGIGESNAVSALIRVLQKQSCCKNLDRSRGQSSYSFQAYTEVPSTPLSGGEGQGGAQPAKHRRLDLVVTWGCREYLEGRLLVEAKRLHNTSTAESLTRDIDRINEFRFIEENNDGAQVLNRLESDLGLIVALTCDNDLADWWEGQFDIGKKGSMGRFPKRKWGQAWQDLGDALTGLVNPVGGFEELDWDELFDEGKGSEYFLYVFFSRSGHSV